MAKNCNFVGCNGRRMRCSGIEVDLLVALEQLVQGFGAAAPAPSLSAKRHKASQPPAGRFSEKKAYLGVSVQALDEQKRSSLGLAAEQNGT